MDNKQQYYKKSLCRFYLRGLCIYSSKECEFSHGIWDLNYDYWKEDEVIEYDYHKTKDGIQTSKKGPAIYKDLYEFQTQKVYSLEEIGTIRQIRCEIRNIMHQQLYEEFIQFLQFKHPELTFTQTFLVREFTRVGFNKILNGPMKFSHITSYLCDVPRSKYFKTNLTLPPNQNKQNVIIRKANDQEVIAIYKQQYKKIVETSEKPLDQNILKKKLFTANFPINIPPLNQVLKDKKLSLPDFVSKILGQEKSGIIFQLTIQSMLQQCLNYLKEKLPKALVTWNDIYNHLTKVLKANNGNILNQVKPNLVLQNNLFLFFPTVQFIFNPSINSDLFKQLKHQPCKCSYQQPYNQQELLFSFKNNITELKQGQSYDINNFESLIACAPHILQSSILGVDLQGNLRRGGFVEMIQLNNGRNTFLIDIWDMNEKGDFQTFWLVRKILRNVMVNPKVLKIFHDCRHDSIGLHQMIETCIVNVFDTSACQTLIMQLDHYKQLLKNKEKDIKQLLHQSKAAIAHCNNVKTLGLNQILKKYEARHGINKNKDKYHRMWSKGEVSFFCKRPIDADYRDYCIRDVLDLPEVYNKMISCLPAEAVEIAYWISGLYAQSAYQKDQRQ